jgi:predicted O-methyltransferase YrrM
MVGPLAKDRKELSATAPFSLDPKMIAAILAHAKPLGHGEDASNLNLGFGFVYYGLARAIRPKHVVVIGSGYGFSVVCLALALKDNQLGKLSFVDPSYSLVRDGPARTIGGVNFWRDPEHVRSHFARFGVENLVVHYKQTSEQFFADYASLRLPAIDLAFIDGNHSYQHVRHDVVATLQRSRRGTYLFLHDTNLYFREFFRHAGVKRWLKRNGARLKEAFEYVDFPIASGVALIRVREPNAWKECL